MTKQYQQNKRYNLFGVAVNVANLTNTTATLWQQVMVEKKVGYVCVTGVHGIIIAQEDKQFCQILNQSLRVTTDGMPLVWLLKAAGFSNVGRVYGPELMQAVVQAGLPCGGKHLLYGGNQGIADKLKQCLQQQHPSLQIVGTATPPYRPLHVGEETALLADILIRQPHFVWVGISTPKQEKLMAQFIQKYQYELAQLPHGVIFIGVGAAFDLLSGTVRQAPKWLRNIGLEWLFRLLMEPKRLAKRYCYNNCKFIVLVIRRFLASYLRKTSQEND